MRSPIHLPSGRVVALEGAVDAPRRRATREPLFSELLDLAARGAVVVRERGERLDLRTLDLRDFHTLRAIATRLGWIAEEPVSIACRNCAAEMEVAPCASLALGPYEDGELDDPELDRTLDLSRPHPIPRVVLPDGSAAGDVTLRTPTVAEAAPLHRALRRRRLVLSPEVVRAMGVTALGAERDARAIAKALERCPDEAWGRIGDWFLAAHYPRRLGAAVPCPGCGARNDVDAPYEREFEPSPGTARTADLVFPGFDPFAARAEAGWGALGEAAAAHLRLVVERGTPACDAGGEPLLGAYVPPGGEPTAPVGSGEIVLYYRTFRAMWEEDGPYDWEAEIDETLAHELEHHGGWLVGHDPMDDAEHDEIAREHARVVGRAATARRSLETFRLDLVSFVARTWPLWAVLAAVTIAMTECGR